MHPEQIKRFLPSERFALPPIFPVRDARFRMSRYNLSMLVIFFPYDHPKMLTGCTPPAVYEAHAQCALVSLIHTAPRCRCISCFLHGGCQRSQHTTACRSEMYAECAALPCGAPRACFELPYIVLACCERMTHQARAAGQNSATPIQRPSCSAPPGLHPCTDAPPPRSLS